MTKDSKIFIGMYKNIQNINKETTKIISKYNLTLSQFSVLEMLYSKGNLCIREVRDLIFSSPGTIPVIINNLEKAGYIFRKTKNNDKRVCILELSEKGRKIISEIMPTNMEMIHSKFSVLTEEEKNILISLLKKIGNK